VNCEKGNFNSAANKTNAHALLLKRLQMMWLVLHHLIGCKIEKGWRRKGTSSAFFVSVFLCVGQHSHYWSGWWLFWTTLNSCSIF